MRQSLVDDLYDHIAISVDMSSAWLLPDEDQHQQHSGWRKSAVETSDQIP
jgi:hypothetical protein